jgi:predicted acyl esterase
MRVERDVEIPMDDGLSLRANVFLPDAPGQYPVVLTHGPYGKDVHFRDWNPAAWEMLNRRHPDFCQGSSCTYMNWETVDPERWVPEGYAVVRVDARGSGKSPGRLEIYSPRDARDMYESIEWAGTQPWSSGKVGLLGISYYAIAQWRVASLQPPHLAAMIPWEGWSDQYRDRAYHGGIFSNHFISNWFANSIVRMQHGSGNPPGRDPITGELPTGDEILSEPDLRRNRVEFPDELKKHPLDDAWHRDRSADYSRIVVPFLSAGNWGGMGLHLRGNVEGFVRSASSHKWLEMHTGNHWEAFYTEAGRSLQQRFFDQFLKGIDTGWDREPPLRLAIRRPDGATYRHEHEWPLARTQWTRAYLDATSVGLAYENPPAESHLSYPALSDGATFRMPPFEHATEITGPLKLHVWVSSSTQDMDMFATLRAVDQQGEEITFEGASEPRVPIAQGWLRASHRKTDPERSTEYQPFHTHDVVEKLTPGVAYELDVEIWPTSMVYPAGSQLALTLQGKDFERQGSTGPFRGSGPFLHNDPDDRDPATFGGTNTIYTGGDRASYLLLPIIPPTT